MEAEAVAHARTRPRAASAVSLRVATWNIHGAVGADQRYAPERIVDVLTEMGADIVALQEVASAQAHENFIVGGRGGRAGVAAGGGRAAGDERNGGEGHSDRAIYSGEAFRHRGSWSEN